MSDDGAPDPSGHPLHVVQRHLELKRSELMERLYRVRRDREPDPEPAPGPWRPRQSDEVLAKVETVVARELHEIRQALDRIAAGKYGSCEECGRPIDTLRLGIRPCVATCQACGGDATSAVPEASPG